MRRAAIGVALTLAGCRTATIPYDLEKVAQRKTPIHARSLVVVPFVDAREGTDRDSDEPIFVYGGIAYRTTDLSHLQGTAERTLAELLARHLVKAGVFASVILVDRIEDAPEADLVLAATIRRARGYAEAEGRSAESKKPRDRRSVLAEVWLEDVTITERGGTHRALFDVDLGWSILEERIGEPDPWAILGEALATVGQQAVRLLASADLEGGYVVLPAVALGAATSSGAPGLDALATAAPPGWRVTTSTASPGGWKRTAGECQSTVLRAAQTQRFHRVLGPYVPTVRVSWCGLDARLEIDDRVEFPAVYLGKSKRGAHVFVEALGASNWPRAADQISRFFEIDAPPKRHIFVITP